MMEIELKYIACIMSQALSGNINDNFESVSFDILDNGDVQTKFVFSELTEQEEEYIEEVLFEFSVLEDCLLDPIVEVGDSPPLKNLVYRKA